MPDRAAAHRRRKNRWQTCSEAHSAQPSRHLCPPRMRRPKRSPAPGGRSGIYRRGVIACWWAGHARRRRHPRRPGAGQSLPPARPDALGRCRIGRHLRHVGARRTQSQPARQGRFPHDEEYRGHTAVRQAITRTSRAPIMSKSRCSATAISIGMASRLRATSSNSARRGLPHMLPTRKSISRATRRCLTVSWPARSRCLRGKA